MTIIDTSEDDEVTVDNPDDALLDAKLVRRTKVMFLKNGGATWKQIAAAVGASISTCRADFSVVCTDINNENPANVRARHRAVIFDIQRSMYPRMMGTDNAVAVRAAKTILQALERESRLLGLDSPVKILAATSNEDFANEAARLITSIQQIDADTLKELTRGHSPTTIDAETVDESPAEADGESYQTGARDNDLPAAAVPVPELDADTGGGQASAGQAVSDPHATADDGAEGQWTWNDDSWSNID
jgi:hypothetical protein